MHTERRGLELQATPLRLERGKRGQYRWGIEPAVEYCVSPRTQLEVGFPLAWRDYGLPGCRSGLAGIDVSVLHNLNVETRLPALAIAADLLLPGGSLASKTTYPSVTGIATKSLMPAPSRRIRRSTPDTRSRRARRLTAASGVA